jgi:hypothetical protein
VASPYKITCVPRPATARSYDAVEGVSCARGGDSCYLVTEAHVPLTLPGTSRELSRSPEGGEDPIDGNGRKIL